MRDYAKVSPLFWTGNTGREIRSLGQECQLAALYLMTGPGATMLGVYHMPAVLLAHAIGSPLEGATKALRSLSEGGFCVYDEDSEWVWVREMAAWQIDDELARDDNRVKGIAKDWLALPNLPFLQEFFERYASAFHLPHRPNNQAPTKALQSPSQAPPKPGAGTGEGTRTGREYSAPRSSSAAPASRVEHPELALSPVFIEMPLNTGAPFEIRDGYVTELGKLYPAVDVKQALRSMKGWLDANPRKRKTRTGIKRFLNSWLAREQDRGGSSQPPGAPVSRAGTLSAEDVT